jgi:hypothetical protein
LGSTASLELLAKAFNNSCLDEHVFVLLQAFRADKSARLAKEFLERWYSEDGFSYLFAALLECPDKAARNHVATLLKYVLVVLKMQEKDYLLEAEEYEVEGEKGEKNGHGALPSSLHPFCGRGAGSLEHLSRQELEPLRAVPRGFTLPGTS